MDLGKRKRKSLPQTPSINLQKEIKNPVLLFEMKTQSCSTYSIRHCFLEWWISWESINRHQADSGFFSLE